MNIYCFSPFGYEGNLVHIEIDLRRGIPAIDIVGLADSAVKESRERMKSAIVNSGLIFPPERVLISLSPADLKKEGAGFDLAVALSVLDAKDHLSSTCQDDENILVMGELELNGKIRPVRGIHAAVTTAKSEGITKCIVPIQNADEARTVTGMHVLGAESLLDAYKNFRDGKKYLEESKTDSAFHLMNGIPENAENIDGILFPPVTEEFEYKNIIGQEKLVRALQIAASGGHNILAYGPPGCGKTLSLQKFQTLLPYLSLEKSQSVTRIFSIAGLMPSGKSLIREPPFRIPHQTATIEGMCGGGTHCTPGEISLSHEGVLFLDEASEFRSSVLQMLRVPLESGKITLSRAGRSTVFPASFQLLMSTNPCPCGNYGSKTKLCLCSARSIEQYWKKFSAPLLDRIDIRVQVDLTAANREENKESSVSTSELRIKIAKAFKIQEKRQGKKNVFLTPAEVNEICVMDEDAKSMLHESVAQNDFSPRAECGCKKLARTIADMEGKEIIDGECMKEACGYRKPTDIL